MLLNPSNAQRVGDGAWRWPLLPGMDRGALRSWLEAQVGVWAVVMSEDWVMVTFDPGVGPPVFRALPVVAGEVRPSQCHTFGARYQGPDLQRVADWAGISVGAVIERHSSVCYTVLYLGFLPGFAYLAEVDPVIACPRLPQPRPRVPAGAVGIAGARTGIYPGPSPGGWNWVAQVEVALFDALRGPLLKPGDQLRFVPC